MVREGLIKPVKLWDAKIFYELFQEYYFQWLVILNVIHF